MNTEEQKNHYNEMTDYVEMKGLKRFIVVSMRFKLVQWLYGKKNYDILDLGCGDCILLNYIKTFRSYTGLEIADKRVEKDNLKLKNIENAIAVCGNVEKMPFKDNYFDTIFACDILEHVENLDKTKDEIHRVMKWDAELIISTPTENWLYKLGVKLTGGEDRFHLRGSQEIENILKPQFKSVRSIGIPFIIPIKSINLFMIQKWIKR